MKNLRCIIVDDEPGARKILQEFAGKASFLDLKGKFENIARADSYLRDNKTELIFLDIEMPKMSGLEYLRRSDTKTMVILTTAFPQYALQGYELNIIDYLLKPFAFERFLKAVQKAKEFSEAKETTNWDGVAPFIFVRSEKRIEKIELNNILFIEGLGNYVTIFSGNKKIIAYLTLKSLENQLPASHFIKTHHSFLVNCSRISFIEGDEIKILDHVLPISRKYKEALMQMVGEKLLKR
jgi:DNA-binding LytR/AlgR family response regulator